MGTTTSRLDDRGRLVLPAQLRRRLGWQSGNEMVIVDESDGVRLKSRRGAAHGLIGLAAPAGHSVVDELRGLRDREAAAENEAAGTGP